MPFKVTVSFLIPPIIFSLIKKLGFTSIVFIVIFEFDFFWLLQEVKIIVKRKKVKWHGANFETWKILTIFRIKNKD